MITDSGTTRGETNHFRGCRVSGNWDAFHFSVKSFIPDITKRLLTECRHALIKGHCFLRRNQKTSGEFPAYVASSNYPDLAMPIPPSPFITGLVVLVLRDSRLDYFCHDIIKPALTWLEKCRNVDQTYSFIPGSFSKSYPADVDDTAVAWSALLRMQHVARKRIPVQTIMNRLDEKGLVPTWFDNRFDNPIDDCVQVNVLDFLYNAGIRVPSLETRIKKCIESENDSILAPYYQNPLMFYYFVSRLALNPQGRWLLYLSGDISRHIRAIPRNIHRSPLTISVEILANIRLLKRLDQNLLVFLLQNQEPEGNWGGESLFYHRDRRLSYLSPAFNTALSMAAIKSSLKCLERN